MSLSTPTFISAIPNDWLSRRIQRVFARSEKNILIQDRDRALTGSDLGQIVGEIKSQLEFMTSMGSRVAIAFPNSSAQAVAILACLYARRVPVILSPDSAHKIVDRIKFSKVAAVISPIGFLNSDPGVSQILVSADGQMVDTKLKLAVGGLATITDPRVAIVLLTSGSKGEPKAVQLTHDGLNYIIDYLIGYFGLDEGSRAAINLPIFHTMALNTQFLPTFLARGTSLFMNSEQDSTSTYSTLLREKANFLTVIGDLLFLYKKEREIRRLPAAHDVHHIQMAGGMISQEYLEMARALFPNALIHKGYGLTEVIRTAMIHSDQPGFMDDCVGYVLPNQVVEIRDSENQPLPVGEIGEIFIKSPSTMLNYQGSSPSPFDEKGFFASGDLGYFDPQGRLHFSGRSDEIFKMRGKKISAVEIERAARRLDMVSDAKCIGVPCRRRGARPVLIIEAVKSGQKKIADLSKLIRRCLFEHLEEYKVPADILVVDRLPRLPNRKINIRAVQDLWKERSARSSRTEPAAT